MERSSCMRLLWTCPIYWTLGMCGSFSPINSLVMSRSQVTVEENSLIYIWPCPLLMSVSVALWEASSSCKLLPWFVTMSLLSWVALGHIYLVLSGLMSAKAWPRLWLFFLSAMVTAPWGKPSTDLTSPVLSWTPGDSTMLWGWVKGWGLFCGDGGRGSELSCNWVMGSTGQERPRHGRRGCCVLLHQVVDGSCVDKCPKPPLWSVEMERHIGGGNIGDGLSLA